MVTQFETGGVVLESLNLGPGRLLNLRVEAAGFEMRSGRKDDSSLVSFFRTRGKKPRRRSASLHPNLL